MKSTSTVKPPRSRPGPVNAEPVRVHDDADADQTIRPVERGRPQGVVGALVAALLAPQRVVTDIATIASAVVTLQRDALHRLASIDARAGALVTGVGALRAPLDRVDRKISELTSLEEAVTLRMDAIREDLNLRMLAVEAELRGMRRPIAEMTRDLAAVVQLLPSPSDGPLARLRDTLTAS